MAYLIVFLVVIFSQTVVHANEFEETIVAQNHVSATVLQLTTDEQKWLAKHKNIRIAYDGGLPPYSFVNDQGKIDGIAVEIMATLSQRLAINFTVYPSFNWNSLYRAGAKRKVDMIATMVNRPDRADWFSFTKPYLTKSLVIVTKQDNTSINNRNDLGDKKVVVVKGYQYGEQVGNEFPSAKRIKADSMLDSLKQVDNGQVDAAILFLGSANYLQAKYQLGNLKIAAFYDRNSANESIAVRKDWPILVGILQKGLDSLTEKEVQKIFAKWVVQAGVPSSSDAIPQKTQPPTEPVTKLVVEIEQQPAAFSVPKAVLEPSRDTVEISKLVSVLLMALALFLLGLALIRKQQRLQIKAKNEIMTPARNLQSTHKDAMHLTIEPPVEIFEEEPSPELDAQTEYSDEIGIENLRAIPEHPEYLDDGSIHYQHDGDGRFIYVSPSVTSLLGYSEADFMANYRNYLTDNPVNRRLDDHIGACIRGQPSQPYEIEIYDTGQDIHWLAVMDSPVYDGQGHCIGIDGVMRDITAQRLYEKLLVKLSEPEVPVKPKHLQALQEHLEQAIQLANNSHKPFGMICFAMDRLRFLDGNVAHLLKDEVFIESGKRLSAILRDTDTVVELEAGKFALILPETGVHAVGRIVEKIRKILQVPYLVGGQSIVLDANMGSAVYPGKNSEPQSLISEAQTLFTFGESQQSKASLSMDSRLEEDSLHLQQDLVFALDECTLSLRASSPHNINALNRHSQFTVCYQSRHNLEDYNITGFEALIRWHHPELGLILPKDFVDLVKGIGLLDVMTYWIIQQVSFQTMVWEKQGIRPGLMAINLGDLAIKQAVEVNKIIAIINETGAKPEWLAFSIPESEIAKNPDLVIPIIKQLVAAGFTVAIDNFGSDSSLLALLKTIPAQIIEIDPAFIRDLPDNTADAEIITYSTAMLHELGKTVIAKEVETEQQLEFLKISGCDMIQGHLLSRPLPAKEAKELMETLPDFAWYLQQKR
ncbi:EAL domain-containing protein [Methyloglobulus sp.]|uniref:EAL domain-containing protein n=1 Tax=Methyloglobulus sp. TaxID=2518622 RepID=UPI003989DA8F